MPKVSVIIPIYNSGKYIEGCLRSLFEQTLDDIEYIFIDDCSTDESVEILKAVLKEYPKRCSYVSLIRNTKNCGPSTSRNNGIEKAVGKYIIFCDSDDIVERDGYELMYNMAEENEADMVSCGVYVDSNNESIPILFEKQVPLSKTLQDCDTLEGVLYSSSCNKLIRRDLLIDNNIRFDGSIRMWDDLYFTFIVRFYCKIDCVLNKPLYHYCKYNDDSITSQNALIKSESQIRCVELLEIFLRNNVCINYDYILNFLKLRSKDLLFCSDYINNWIHVYKEAHKWIYRYIGFYGIARILRFYIVAFGGEFGWSILDLYARIKYKIKGKK